MKNDWDPLVEIEPKDKRSEPKIPLRPPLKKVGRVTFSPLHGEKPRPLDHLTDREISPLSRIQVPMEVVYGKTRISLGELAGLQPGHLIRLNEVCDELVDLYANGKKIGRGEIVAYDHQFGIRIVTLEP